VIALIALFAGLAVLAAGLTVLPLLRPRAASPSRARFDTAVYADQLRELERDVGRGLLAESELKGARLEIERRLLAAASVAPETTVAGIANPTLATVLALLVVGGAVATYARFGSPGVADAPAGASAASRAAAGVHPDLGVEAAALAAKLQANPNDAAGWELYARTLAALRDWRGSARAYGRLISLGHTDPETEAAAGEMVVLSADGVVTPEAEATFRQALAQDPANPIARFYLALALAQSGHGREAIAAWNTLAGEIGNRAMRQEIARRIAQVAKENGLPVPPLPPPASAASSEAEAAAQHRAMLQGMVGELEAKVAAAPDDTQSWLALGSAYGALGDQAKAATAFRHAAALAPADATVLLAEARAQIAGRKEGEPVPASAVTELKRAAEIDPKNPEIQWYLGLIAAEQNDVAGARSYWQKALTLLPPDSANYQTVTEALKTLPEK
jgi:cytochrome c-type biogenesis protein CcmH